MPWVVSERSVLVNKLESLYGCTLMNLESSLTGATSFKTNSIIVHKELLGDTISTSACIALRRDKQNINQALFVYFTKNIRRMQFVQI